MAFRWKDKSDIWKGEGIYFLTFNVKNRAQLLGSLRRLDAPEASSSTPAHIATVDGTALGNAVYRLFNSLQSKHAGFHVLAKQVMPNHFHAVCWCREGFGETSIKMVARSFAQACSREARRLYQLQQQEAQQAARAQLEAQQEARYNRANTNGAAPTPAATLAAATTTAALAATATAAAPTPAATLAAPTATAATLAAATAAATAATTAAAALSSPTAPSIPAQFYCANPLDCGNGESTLFETPFIRTLAHPGQLRRMIDYTHNNPDNLQRVTDNPDLYTIHRRQSIAGLLFDTMGKARILDYPDRYVVDLPRALTPEQIDDEVRRALRIAEKGTVIYCAAINAAEKAVAKAIRTARYPLVIMMLEGFPPQGTEAARFFHPGGAYHQACGEGRLVLLAPLPDCYTSPALIDRTERELSRKAAQKGHHYTPIPHSSTRWRMIAGNMMLHTIVEAL